MPRTKKARVPPKPKQSAGDKAELKALFLLIKHHGYMLTPMRAGKRVSMVMTNGLKDIQPMYTFTLRVPMGSALSKQTQQYAPVKTK